MPLEYLSAGGDGGDTRRKGLSCLKTPKLTTRKGNGSDAVMVLVVPSRSSELVAKGCPDGQRRQTQPGTSSVGACNCVPVLIARVEGANCFDRWEQERKIAGDQ